MAVGAARAPEAQGKEEGGLAQQPGSQLPYPAPQCPWSGLRPSPPWGSRQSQGPLLDPGRPGATCAPHPCWYEPLRFVPLHKGCQHISAQRADCFETPQAQRGQLRLAHGSRDSACPKLLSQPLWTWKTLLLPLSSLRRGSSVVSGVEVLDGLGHMPEGHRQCSLAPCPCASVARGSIGREVF